MKEPGAFTEPQEGWSGKSVNTAAGILGSPVISFPDLRLAVVFKSQLRVQECQRDTFFVAQRTVPEPPAQDPEASGV